MSLKTQTFTKHFVPSLNSLLIGTASIAIIGGCSAINKPILGSTAYAQTQDMRSKVMAPTPRVTYLGGPTYLIEIGEFRILSDPGFDPQGSERIEGPGHTLTKIMEPPIPPSEIGRIDFALVSHAQHLDNLDNEGRKILKKVGQTFTTPDSAALLSDTRNVRGLKPWQKYKVTNSSGQSVTVTAMPAVHTSNPALREVIGEVSGYMLEWDGQTHGAFYISGDTVYIDDMKEIGERYKISSAILHMGRANVPAVGDNFLTMDGEQGARATRDLNIPTVYPAHFEGWRHFPEGAWYIIKDFEDAGVIDRLHLLRPGQVEDVPVPN